MFNKISTVISKFVSVLNAVKGETNQPVVLMGNRNVFSGIWSFNMFKELNPWCMEYNLLVAMSTGRVINDPYHNGVQFKFIQVSDLRKEVTRMLITLKLQPEELRKEIEKVEATGAANLKVAQLLADYYNNPEKDSGLSEARDALMKHNAKTLIEFHKRFFDEKIKIGPFWAVGKEAWQIDTDELLNLLEI